MNRTIARRRPSRIAPRPASIPASLSGTAEVVVRCESGNVRVELSAPLDMGPNREGAPVLVTFTEPGEGVDQFSVLAENLTDLLRALDAAVLLARSAGGI